MDVPVTIALLALVIAFAVLAGVRDARPASHKPRLMPWRALLLLSSVVALILLVHLVNALGFKTGR